VWHETTGRFAVLPEVWIVCAGNICEQSITHWYRCGSSSCACIGADAASGRAAQDHAHMAEQTQTEGRQDLRLLGGGPLGCLNNAGESMRVLTVSVFVLLVASAGLAAQDKPTVKQCKANLNQWVPMFKAVYEDPACKGDGSPSCPFAAPVRNLDIGELVHIPFEAEACAKVNRRRRYDYQRVATRAENIVVMRTVYFLKSEDQTDRYIEWERSQQRVSSPAKAPTRTDTDEPTVSENR
jgi:hypothetical protein